MTTTFASRPRIVRRRLPRTSGLISFAIVTAILVVQTYPLVWLFVTSLRRPMDFAVGGAFSLPTGLTLDNYARAFAEADLLIYIRNSIIVTSVSLIAIVVLSAMGAYAIRLLHFRLDRLVLSLFLAGIIVPVQVVLIPLFVDYSAYGILNSYAALILPMAGFGLSISILLFVNFLDFLPAEIIEAAVLDGCGPYSVFSRIVLPMSGNTIVTIVFVNSIFIWNDFVFSNTFIFDEKTKTIALGLQNYIGTMGAVDWTATFAAVCVTISPVLLAFFVLNRIIIQGVAAGALKG
jgi:raffinose/stachyose/melibiose transport system permease protein